MQHQFVVETGKAEIRAESHGEGTPIVFLHAGVADRRMWSPQLNEFSKTHRALAYDRRGFGQTTAPDEPFSHVHDLLAVLDQTGVDKTVLCGCSQGARIAIDFALNHPSRVNSLVLAGATYSGAPWMEITDREIVLVKKLDTAEELDDLEAVNKLEAHLWLDGPSSAEGRASDHLRELFMDMNAIALASPELTQEIKPASVDTALNQIACPTLLIEGDLDFEMIQRHHTTLEKNIPESTRIVMNGTAHLPSMDQPAVFNEHIRTFLSRFSC